MKTEREEEVGKGKVPMPQRPFPAGTGGSGLGPFQLDPVCSIRSDPESGTDFVDEMIGQGIAATPNIRVKIATYEGRGGEFFRPPENGLTCRERLGVCRPFV